MKTSDLPTPSNAAEREYQEVEARPISQKAFKFLGLGLQSGELSVVALLSEALDQAEAPPTVLEQAQRTWERCIRLQAENRYSAAYRVVLGLESGMDNPEETEGHPLQMAASRQEAHKLVLGFAANHSLW